MNDATEGLVLISIGRLFHKLHQKTAGDFELWVDRCKEGLKSKALRRF